MFAAQFPGLRQAVSFLGGWQGLRRFWVGALLVVGTGLGLLEVMGPPARRASTVAAVPGNHPPEHVASDIEAPEAPQSGARAAARPTSQLVHQLALRAATPGRDSPGPIADPDPSLLEPYPGEANLKLPRVAPDGRAPMAAYAAAFDPSSVRPRVGMLIAGSGLSEAGTLAAIKELPGGVTLAISPYAGDINHLLDVARITEHEYLLSVPMEPQGYPVRDPDDRHALMTSLPPAENVNRLRWAMSRFAGYVGVTSALGSMRGERLVGVPDQFGAVLEEIGHRGLLFIDARTGQSALPYAWNRSVDVVIDDDPVDIATLDQRLDALSHIALDKGSALGIVWVPRPVTLSRVAAWTNTLTARGLALAPLSALALPPVKRETEK